VALKRIDRDVLVQTLMKAAEQDGEAITLSNVLFVIGVMEGLRYDISKPLEEDGEPGTLNERKQLNRLIEDSDKLRAVLSNEFWDEVRGNGDWSIQPVVDRAIRVMRLLKVRAEGLQEKFRIMNRDREQFESEREEIAAYIDETFPKRAGMLAKGGCDTWQMLVIGLMENLRDELESLVGTAEPRPDDRHDKPMTADKGDTMQPHARRNVTLNDLRAMLRDMLFSGVDVPVRDLDSFLEGYVTAVDIAVRRSMELEGYTDECCQGCTEHVGISKDPKYDRNHPAQPGRRR
jgi:hypothetical protein